MPRPGRACGRLVNGSHNSSLIAKESSQGKVNIASHIRPVLVRMSLALPAMMLLCVIYGAFSTFASSGIAVSPFHTWPPSKRWT